jgi:CMP/dCMP kinase
VTRGILAIDGPAGAGKSTVARRVADALGIPMLDTGAMYRAVALAVLERGVGLDDPEGCAAIAASVAIDVTDRVTLDGRDVTTEIRTPEATAAVSAVSAHSGVRSVIVEQQREWAQRRRSGVIEGRDIGSVVVPDARLKIFLTASIDERAERRAADERAAGRPVDFDAIRALIVRRDELDSTRSVSPLVQASDAVVVDTTGRTIEAVVDEIASHYRARSDD